MAIDDGALTRQRLALVPRHETRCDRCGKRTTNRRGTCGVCQGAHIPRLYRLSTEQLTGLIDSCRSELERRRSELEAALRGTR